MNSTVDLHMHTTVSDGTDYPEDLIGKLKERGIQTFSVTDHDAIDGTLTMQKLVPEDMEFYPGIEFSCVTDIGKVHILGYGFDPENGVFRAVLEKGRKMRTVKLDKRIAFLKDNFDIQISDIEIEAFHRMKACGKPHLANMLVEKGYAKNRNEAIRKFLNPCNTSDMKIRSVEAIAGINEAGGIAVWAHPLGEGFHTDRNGNRFRNMEQTYAQLQGLLREGIKGMECWYSQYNESQINDLVRTAEAYKLLISGGSDYHGRNKDIETGTLNAWGKTLTPGDLNIVRALRELRG